MTGLRVEEDPRIAEVYLRVERTHWWYRGRRRILEDLIDTHLGAGPGRAADHPRGGWAGGRGASRPLRLLDIGCGSGMFLPALGQYGEAHGLESDTVLVERGRSEGRSILRQHFPDDPIEGTFDVVTLFDVLEHIRDDLAALRGVREILNPGGRLFLAVPALPWLWTPHDEAVGHHRRYVDAPLRRLVRRAGFEVLTSSYFNTLLLPLVVAHKVLRRSRGHHLDIPPEPWNGILRRVFETERSVVAGRGFRIGSSLAVVARRREAAGDRRSDGRERMEIHREASS